MLRLSGASGMTSYRRLQILFFCNRAVFGIDDVPEWDWWECFHGRLHKPVNCCRLDYVLNKEGLIPADIDAQCIRALKQLKYLEHLFIETAEGHKHVEIPFDCFSKLEFLEVAAPLSRREIASIAQLNKLKSLVLDDNQLDDETLSVISNLQGVRRLNVYSPLISNTGLASIQNLSLLEDLALGGKAITDDGLIHLRNMRSLSKLYLGNTKISGIGFGVLKGLPIEDLNLTESSINEMGIAAIVKVFPDLRELNMNFTDLSNEGVELITTNLPQLRTLDISGTNITDECVPNLMKLKSLKTISVTSTSLSKEALAALKSIDGCEVIY